jgi:hypothetical protein
MVRSSARILGEGVGSRSPNVRLGAIEQMPNRFPFHAIHA